jgi:hypothetical protein
MSPMHLKRMVLLLLLLLFCANESQAILTGQLGPAPHVLTSFRKTNATKRAVGGFLTNAMRKVPLCRLVRGRTYPAVC